MMLLECNKMLIFYFHVILVDDQNNPIYSSYPSETKEVGRVLGFSRLGSHIFSGASQLGSSWPNKQHLSVSCELENLGTLG